MLPANARHGKPTRRNQARLAWWMVAAVAVAEFLGMTLWFSATAIAPALVREFHLSASGAAWMTTAVQAGFVAGTLISAFLNLADLVSSRRLVALGCMAAAAANALLAVAPNAATAFALRSATGAALACVYPPGMKLAASWIANRRGTALGILIGALTAGKGFPHAFAWLAGPASWRTVVLLLSLFPVAGAAIVWLFVRDGPFLTASSRFDPAAAIKVFAHRGTRLATLGYLGHMWELYAMWTWTAAFAAASLAASATPDAQSLSSLIAAVSIGAGAAGCIVAGIWADRIGKARVASAAMVTSGACAALTAAAFGAHPVMLIALLVAWGFSVVADSAQFSALVSEHTPAEHVGTALTVQTCTGFLLTMVSIQLTGMVAVAAGWRWAFLTLVPGPLLGAFIMNALRKSAPPPQQVS